MNAAGRAINKLLDYLWEDEYEDYLQYAADLQGHHLFLSLAVLANSDTAESIARSLHESSGRIPQGDPKNKKLHVPWKHLPKRLQEHKIAVVTEVFGIRDRLPQKEGDLSTSCSTSEPKQQKNQPKEVGPV